MSKAKQPTRPKSLSSLEAETSDLKSLVDVDRKQRAKSEDAELEAQLAAEEAKENDRMAARSAREVRVEALRALRKAKVTQDAAALETASRLKTPKPKLFADAKIYEVRGDQPQNFLARSRCFRPGEMFLAWPDEVEGSELVELVE